MIAISYETSNQLDLQSNLCDVCLAHDLDKSLTMIIIKSVGGLQLFIGIRFLLFYIMKKIFMSIHSTQYRLTMERLESFSKFKYWMRYFILDPNIIYYTLYTVLAILGLTIHLFFFAFHLYEIMNQFKTTKICSRPMNQPCTAAPLYFT